MMIILAVIYCHNHYNHHILCCSGWWWWWCCPGIIVLPNKGYPEVEGRLLILSFSISASFSLFSFALRFWNQIFTWVSVKLRDDENSALSAIERYCFVLNFLSKARSCWVVKGVLGFLLLLCRRRVHLMFGSLCPSGASVNRMTRKGQDKMTRKWQEEQQVSRA